MCLITEQKRAKVAVEDIPCYKVLTYQRSQLKSPYQDFVYEVGKLYKVKFTIVRNHSDGVRFCSADNVATDAYENWKVGSRWKKGTIAIEHGFHSCKEADRALVSCDSTVKFERCALVTCTIPKGAHYYEDVTGLLCSNQIIINEIVEVL